MANNLETEKKVLAVSMLAEGNSIRSIERITGVHRDTIMRLPLAMRSTMRGQAGISGYGFQIRTLLDFG
jgi:transposase-like protein